VALSVDEILDDAVAGFCLLHNLSTRQCIALRVLVTTLIDRDRSWWVGELQRSANGAQTVQEIRRKIDQVLLDNYLE
jgi:hypothetical protein